MAGGKEISDSELLIDILMLGAFVNTPMTDGVCVPAGIGQTELKIVMSLAGTGEMAGHDLVEIIGIAPMNVSRALRQLRERGWIEDAPDSENRRRKPVRLTEEGFAAYARLEPDFNELAGSLLGSLTKVQKQQFRVAARRILTNMADWITSHHTEVKWDPEATPGAAKAAD